MEDFSHRFMVQLGGSKGHLEEAGSKLSAHHKHLGLFMVIGVGIICYGHHALILIMLKSNDIANCLRLNSMFHSAYAENTRYLL